MVMPPGLEVDALMGKMSLDKKNEAGRIRCTMVLDIGDCKVQPEPVERGPMEAALRGSVAKGVGKPAWVPFEGHATGTAMDGSAGAEAAAAAKKQKLTHGSGAT